jgi:O-methyltransferase
MNFIKNFIVNFIRNPKVRYSGTFIAIQELFKYYSFEEPLKNSIDFVNFCKVEGDYLEFGVYQGKHFISTYLFAQKCGLTDMRFHAFDSFEGLPEITGLDISAPKQFEKGEYSCDLETFKANITKMGVSLDKVTTTEGWFDKTLNDETKKKLAISKAAIIWIDCDFYESTVPVLSFVTDYIQDGTIIIFDDWFCFKGNPELGQQKAFSEWLSANPNITAAEFYKYGWTGNSFILNLK